MIRDPSDGSVREKPKVEMTSALPTPSVDTKEIARLEKSREWLKNYRVTASNSSITEGENDGACSLETETASGLSVDHGADH